MNSLDRHWTWVGACSVGTSHVRAGRGCDDAGACLEVRTRHGRTLLAVVSDGAGSASLSRLGSRIVTREFCRCAAAFVRRGGKALKLDQDIAEEWLDVIRDHIGYCAKQLGEAPKSLAATVVGALVQSDGAAVMHVGDGACVVRLGRQDDWIVPSWPAQGEYASTTHFVTDNPPPCPVVRTVSGAVIEIAIFTDGLERLALDFTEKAAYRPFFESMFAHLRATPMGRDRNLSRELRAFLDSPRVTDRTDDDKTLILARRLRVVPVEAASQVVAGRGVGDDE